LDENLKAILKELKELNRTLKTIHNDLDGLVDNFSGIQGLLQNLFG